MKSLWNHTSHSNKNIIKHLFTEALYCFHKSNESLKIYMTNYFGTVQQVYPILGSSEDISYNNPTAYMFSVVSTQ